MQIATAPAKSWQECICHLHVLPLHVGICHGFKPQNPKVGDMPYRHMSSQQSSICQLSTAESTCELLVLGLMHQQLEILIPVWVQSVLLDLRLDLAFVPGEKPACAGTKKRR